MPIHASACYSYANNPTLEFLLPVVLVVEAVASAVLSRAYRAVICSMLAIRVFAIGIASHKGMSGTVYNY